MKVLFVQDVTGTAYAGDVKEVKPGFARNYLLPRKLAVQATKDQMNRVEGLQKAASRRREATEGEMKTLSEKLSGSVITIEGRAGRNNRLYGAITSLMVAEQVSKIAGRDIDRRRIVMEPLRQLGTYKIPVKLYTGVEPRVTVVVALPSPEKRGQEAPAAEGQASAAAEGAAPEAEGAAEEPIAEAASTEIVPAAEKPA